MTVKDGHQFAQVLTDWLARKAFVGVSLECAHHNEPDPADDHFFTLECKFNPGPDRAPVWINLTDDGWVGLGVERRSDLARSLGYRFRSSMFAAGVEGHRFDAEDVLAVLDEVAAGAVDFHLRRGPLGCAARTISHRTGKPFAWDQLADRRVVPWGWQLVRRDPWR